MTKKLPLLIALLLVPTLSARSQATPQDTGQEQNPELQDLQVRVVPHKGDIDEMDKRRVVRALVSFNRVSFFFDNGRPRGMAYDALMDLQKFLNRKLHPNDTTGKDKIHVVLVPTTSARVANDLLNGNGDIIAVPIYITEARKKLADFVPVASSQHDVVVSGPDAPPLASLEDLSGKEVYLFKEIVYRFESRKRLGSEFGGNKDTFERWQEYIRSLASNASPALLKKIEYEDQGDNICFCIGKVIGRCIK